MIYVSGLHECRQGKIVFEPVFDLSHQADGQQRMPAEIKEVIRDADGALVQDALPDLGELKFQQIARRPEGAARFVRGIVERPQRWPIYLAIRSQRQTVQI